MRGKDARGRRRRPVPRVLTWGGGPAPGPARARSAPARLPPAGIPRRQPAPPGPAAGCAPARRRLLRRPGMAAVLELLLSEEVAVGAVVRWLRRAPGQRPAEVTRGGTAPHFAARGVSHPAAGRAGNFAHGGGPPEARGRPPGGRAPPSGRREGGTGAAGPLPLAGPRSEAEVEWRRTWPGARCPVAACRLGRRGDAGGCASSRFAGGSGAGAATRYASGAARGPVRTLWCLPTCCWSERGDPLHPSTRSFVTRCGPSVGVAVVVEAFVTTR